MTTCDELRSQADVLISLPERDPERISAEQHARSCTGCAAAISEAVELRSLLGEVPPFSPPSTFALSRASAEILRDLSPSQERRRFELVTLWFAVALSWGLVLALSRGHLVLDQLGVLESLAIALISATIGTATILRKNVALVGAPLLSVAFAFYAGNSGFLNIPLGVRCALMECAAATLPLFALYYLTIFRGTVATTALATGAAAAGAVAAQAALHLACPARHALPHLLVFHSGGVVLSALLGLAVLQVAQLVRAKK